MPATIALRVDGHDVEVPDDGSSLLEVLRDRLGIRTPKDGCSPQGQCGCCTVLVDGQPRVACVTPASRVAGRVVTTVEGLADADRWAEAFSATGASQCGFCTPGIIVRLAAAAASATGPLDDRAVDQALLAHLCRCTGWRTIHDAVQALDAPAPVRDLDAAARRAALEGRTAQAVGPHVALGRGGFADDTAPPEALVAVLSLAGDWVVGETLRGARAAAGKVQGRRSTVAPDWPLAVPPGEWDRVLRTTWVEPAYLEPDASWCVPGGTPAGPLANGGAFGGKLSTDVAAVARRLADEHGRPVRALLSREDVVRLGPKRPPLAAGVRADGTGVVRVVRTPGIADAIRSVAPQLTVEEVDVSGLRTSGAVRAAGWAEAAVLLSSLRDGPDTVRSPEGATASATIDAGGDVHVEVACGPVLDAVVLRSYAIGAAHMALGWVRSEAIAVDADGVPQDLTIRSFGILRAVDTPAVHVTVHHSGSDAGDEPINGSDAVFAAVAAAAWRQASYHDRWPIAH
jgi:aerobic-type carbon monoxide dehydrogenase small subunit (CoxS/CutS family)